MTLDWNEGFGVDLSQRDLAESAIESLRNLCYFMPKEPSFTNFVINKNNLLCAQIPGFSPEETFIIDVIDKRPEFSIVVIDFISYERLFLSDLKIVIEKILPKTVDTAYSKLDKILTPYLKTVYDNHQEFLNLLMAISTNLPPNFMDLLIDSYSATPKIFKSHEAYLSKFLDVETMAISYSVAETNNMISDLDGRVIIQLLQLPVSWLNFASKFSLNLRNTVKNLIDEKRSESLTMFAEKCKNLTASINSIPKLEQLSKCFVNEPFPIVAPERRFIKQGSAAKHCRKKVDNREILLFSDYFGYAQLKGGMYFVPQFYKLVELQAQEPPDNPNSKLLYIYAPRKSFILEFKDVSQRREWYLALANAISNAKENHEGPLPQIDFAPIWIPDRETDECMVCKTKFSVLSRKHHCRACGRVVCKNCLNNKVIMPNINPNKALPVCDLCYRTHSQTK